MKVENAVIFILLINIFSNAQVIEKKIELSFSGTIGAYKSSADASGIFSFSSASDLRYYLITNTRFGYFLNQDFEIEPELQFAIYEGAKPSYNINANVLYNFYLDSSKVKPFLLIGYGIGNFVPFFNKLLYINEKSLPVNQFNAGFGMKIFLASNIAIRTEYRFQLIKYEEELSSYFSPPIIFKYSHYLHNLLIGISLFL